MLSFSSGFTENTFRFRPIQKDDWSSKQGYVMALELVQCLTWQCHPSSPRFLEAFTRKHCKRITSTNLEIQKSGYGSWSSNTSTGSYAPVKGAIESFQLHMLNQWPSGIPLSDHLDRDGEHILPPLHHPTSWGCLCPRRLAWDEEQVTDTARADLCQERRKKGFGFLLLLLVEVF